MRVHRTIVSRLAVGVTLSVAFLLLPSSGVTGYSDSAQAAIGIQNMHQGFDMACAPTASKMQTWWTNSPYWYIGIYLGGENVSCSNNTNLTASWINTVNGQGWSFINIWVGPQSACVFQSGLAHFSNDPNTAYSQGKTSADHAISAAQALGFTGSLIYYDLEGFNTGDSTCLTAAKKFISGWDNQMNSSGWVPGIYGSSSASALDDMYNLSSHPTDAWMAWYSGAWNSPWGITAVPDGDWIFDHRIHQYYAETGTTNECHGGVCLQVDRNCAIGYTAKARDFSLETSEPSGHTEYDGPLEDVPPCGS
jgi:hypothetical protein